MQGELCSPNGVATLVNAAFGKDVQCRPTQAGPPRPTDLPAPEDCQRAPYLEGITPAFSQHFEMRFVSGVLPLSGAASADYSVWLRFREPTKMNTAALIAIGDMPPLPGFNRVRAPAAGSSLSWYLEFPGNPDTIDEHGWWFYDYRCQAASGGYFNNFGSVWAPDGTPAMFTRQVAMVFEK